MTPRYFNPLDRTNLGKSVAEAVLEESPFLIRQIEPFNGAGIYVIYYNGDFPDYDQISRANQTRRGLTTPIYIGKAIPKGGRKGLTAPAATLDQIGPRLFERLMEHRESLEQAINLNPDHFWVKCIIVDDIWIPLGESVLIQQLMPLWNAVLDGFGNHDPGKGRYSGARPNWDALHPGRPWAERCAPARLSIDQIRKNIRAFYADPTKFEFCGDPE